MHFCSRHIASCFVTALNTLGRFQICQYQSDGLGFGTGRLSSLAPLLELNDLHGIWVCLRIMLFQEEVFRLLVATQQWRFEGFANLSVNMYIVRLHEILSKQFADAFLHSRRNTLVNRLFCGAPQRGPATYHHDQSVTDCFRRRGPPWANLWEVQCCKVLSQEKKDCRIPLSGLVYSKISCRKRQNELSQLSLDCWRGLDKIEGCFSCALRAQGGMAGLVHASETDGQSQAQDLRGKKMEKMKLQRV